MKFTDLSREWGRGRELEESPVWTRAYDSGLMNVQHSSGSNGMLHVARCTLLPCGNKKSGKRIVVNQRWSRSRSRSRSSSKSCAVAKHPHTHTHCNRHLAPMFSICNSPPLPSPISRLVQSKLSPMKNVQGNGVAG